MIATAIALLAAGMAPGQVSLTMPATSIPHALEIISQAIGQELSADGDASKGTLVIDVTDVAVDELLQRVAEVTGAVWEARGDQRVLTVSDALAQEQANDAMKGRANDFRSQVEAMMAQLPKWDEHSATRIAQQAMIVARDLYNGRRLEGIGLRRQAVHRSLPSNRLAAQVLSTIDPRAVGAMRPGDVIVYSSSPNRMQRPLPRAAQKYFDEHRRLLQEIRTAVQATLEEVPLLDQADPRWHFAGQTTHPAEYLLTVISQADRNRYRIFLDVADDEGWILGQGFATPVRDSSGANEDVSWPSGNFELSAEALDYYDLVRFFHMALTPRGNRMADLRERWIGEIAAPTQNDPLRPLQTEMLFGSARALDADLVASVPDDAILWLNHIFDFPAVQPSMTVGQVMQIASRRWQCDAHLTDGWLTVRPKSFIAARDAYLNRGALEGATQRATRERRVTIANLATYGARQRSTMALTMSDGRLLALAGGRNLGNMVYYNRLPLLFLGATKIFESLPQQTEYEFGVAQLSNEARDMLEAWAFGDSWQNIAGLDDLWDGEEPDPAHPLGHISKRPTEAMPGGLPASLKGTISLKTNPGLAVDHLDGPFKDARPIVWSYGSYPSGSIEQMADERSARVQEVEQLFVRLEFMLRSKLGLVADMQEDPVVRSNRWLEIDELPKSVIDYWRARYEKMKAEQSAKSKQPPPR